MDSQFAVYLRNKNKLNKKMKTYNALSKSFTDEVKIIMGEGKSIDDAFKLVKLDIIHNFPAKSRFSFELYAFHYC